LWVYIRELDSFGFLTFELFFLISEFCILELLGLTLLLTDSLVLLLFTLGALLFLETVLPLLTALLLEPWLLVCGALFMVPLLLLAWLLEVFFLASAVLECTVF